MVSGLSLTAMAVGGVVAGLLVAGMAGAVSRFTTLKKTPAWQPLTSWP